MTTIRENYTQVCERIRRSCVAAGRDPSEVSLLVVSKTFGAASIEQVFAAGQRAFGENYVQEALGKMAALQHLPIEWHCIGPVQANKTRSVAENFSWVHSIDRLKTAQRLNAQRPLHLPALQVCIQVNMEGESTKSGIDPGAALALGQEIAELPRLRLRGLMFIPPPVADDQLSRAQHARARGLFDFLRASGLALDTLSMGMSGDLESAIACGSSLVRIGSAVFGSRAIPPGPGI